jgi:DNA-directed RNA polymerase subunit L
MIKVRISIERQEEDFLRLKLEEGDPHTINNLLRSLLLESENVKLAGYTKTRTFKEQSMFQIRTTNGAKPIDVMIEKCKEIQTISDEFIEKFERALDN